MNTNDNIKTIQAVYEAFGRADVGTILENLTDDVDGVPKPRARARRGTGFDTARTR